MRRSRGSSFCAGLGGAVLAIALFGCDQTTDGSSGDPPAPPDADVLGDGARLREVIGPASWYSPGNIDSAGCKVPQNKQVRATGQVVAAIDRFDETGDGALGNIYIEDVYADGETPEPYSGVTVFDPAFTPPDLRLIEGDVVDTFGNLQEFLGPSSPFGDCKTLPEIGGTMQFRFDNGPLAPLTVVPENGSDRFAEIKGYENARRYIGMLVRVEGVLIAGAPKKDSAGRYTAALNMGGGLSADDVIKLSNELFDMENEGPELADGAQFRSVTGILTYFYGFKLAPRSADDFEL